ncbi:MAG: sigma-70 family RNA polymerase sigma factor [Bacteroidales bacterium]|nr:sigma-70 family RNA polymerase sigma factor [Bacteroidales bacterium]
MQQEFKVLFDTYFDSVRGFLFYRCGDDELSSDIAQEVFLRIWEKQLMPEKNKEKALLYKIANDLFISHYRRKVTEMNYTQSLVIDETEAGSHQELEYAELSETYNRALSEMAEGYRVAFLMSRVEELKYSEIAERLGISVKAVEKRMTNALSFLRDKLALYATK